MVAHPNYREVFPRFLSATESRAYIDLSEARGFAAAESDYPPSYRNNDRLVLDDAAMAERLFARLRPLVPPTMEITGRDGGLQTWRIAGLNERIRFCRYLPGQRFSIHQDGVHHRAPGLESKLTFMIYLTDSELFEGGDTLFYSGGPGSAPAVVSRIRPRAGSLIVFDHALWHAGETVTAGVKHIMRSDILYRLDGAVDRPAQESFAAAHQGYVWSLAAVGEAHVASGGRDARIRLWSNAGDAVAVLEGHEQSVLGLAQYLPGRLASVSRDRTLRLWDLRTHTCIRSIVAHDAAMLALAALPGRMLATGAADRSIRLWDVKGNPLGILGGHPGWIWQLAFAGDRLIASASEDGSARLWDLESRSLRLALPGRVPLRTLSVSPDLRWLATGDVDGSVALWSLALDGAAGAAKRFRAHGAAVRRVRFLSATCLATAGEDKLVRLWRMPDLARVHEASHANFVTDVLPCQAGYLSASYDGTIARVLGYQL